MQANNHCAYGAGGVLRHCACGDGDGLAPA